MHAHLLQGVLFQVRLASLSGVAYLNVGQLLTLLSLQLNQLHLVNRNCTFAIHPFVIDEMLFFIFHNHGHTLDGAIGYEPKASGLVSLFVFKDNTVF